MIRILSSSSNWSDDRIISEKLGSLLKNEEMRSTVQSLIDFYGTLKERIPKTSPERTKRQLSRTIRECFVMLAMLDSDSRRDNAS